MAAARSISLDVASAGSREAIVVTRRITRGVTGRLLNSTSQQWPSKSSGQPTHCGPGSQTSLHVDDTSKTASTMHNSSHILHDILFRELELLVAQLTCNLHGRSTGQSALQQHQQPTVQSGSYANTVVVCAAIDVQLPTPMTPCLNKTHLSLLRCTAQQCKIK
eukprot:GHUV01025890.1.p1 GENE.GHUV01025890.1~~GHUV01025890.1.p1  ORF type:complete len:163 (+),score=23.07 GHUV01025890.1:340-828(+)